MGDTLGRVRRVGGVVLVATLILCACSTTSANPTTSTTRPGSLNVTPCNYAQVWQGNPTQFSEFATVARFARSATDPNLRSEGGQLASAISDDDDATVDQVMESMFSTCQQLGLVRTTHSSTSTTG